MKNYPHWGSHLPILMKVVRMTTGPVLELGIGLFSTPVLHWLCYETKRELVSYDQDRGYLKMFRNYESNFHKILPVDDWDKIEIERPWDVVLVDHIDERRRFDVARLAGYAKYILVHDANPEEDDRYQYSKVYPLFKYQYLYTKAAPSTMVLSNFEDLSKL